MRKCWWLILLVLEACTSFNAEMQFEPFDEKVLLEEDSLLCNEIISPDFLILKGPSLFVASCRSDSMLWQYALPDMTLLRGGGLKGHGEGEFNLFPMFCRSFSDKLYIWGYTPLTIKGFILGEEQKLQQIEQFTLPQYESFNQMHIVHDSLLIYSAIPSDYAIKKINLKSGKEEGRIDIGRDDHKETFFYKNRGLMAANNEFIVYAYCYKKQIDIYRFSDMRLYKRLVNRSVTPEIRIGDLEHTVQYYVNLVAGTNYIYALCKGKEEYVLEVFDYEGKSVMQYSFVTIPFLFDVDEEMGCLYGYNSDAEEYFFRYELDSLF